MARSSAIIKPAANEATVMTVPDIRRNKGNSEVLAAIERALKAAKTFVQSAVLLEPELNKAAVLCVEHFGKHGDTGPADRLIKGLLACNHPTTTAMVNELKVWFRLNSPIQWDRQGKVFKNKDESKGRIDTNEEPSKADAFYETPQAKRARDAMARAQKAALKDFTAKMLVNNIIGASLGRVKAMESGKDQRKIAEGEGTKINRIIKAVTKALTEVASDDAVEAMKKVA